MYKYVYAIYRYYIHLINTEDFLNQLTIYFVEKQKYN